MAMMGLDPLSICMGFGIGVCLGAAWVTRAVCKEALTNDPDSGSIHRGGVLDEGESELHGRGGRRVPPSVASVRGPGGAGDTGGNQRLVLDARPVDERRRDGAELDIAADIERQKSRLLDPSWEPGWWL